MRDQANLLKTIDLPGGSLMPFASTPGERVHILYGRIWLTEEGNLTDAFLGSGDEVSLATRGLAVIEALGPARVQLYEDVRGPSWLARSLAALYRRGAESIRKRMPRDPRSLGGTA